MRVAVFTYTRDRLDYTKRAFQSLQENAGYPYDHFVLDNGSQDGTGVWLEEQRRLGVLKNVRLWHENVGLHLSWGMVFPMILAAVPSGEPGYDLIIKMDNDCLVKSEGILASLVGLWKGAINLHMILSPRVVGIRNQPARAGYVGCGHQGLTFGRTGYVGGLFMVAPYHFWHNYKIDPQRPMAIGDDTYMCQQANTWGYQIGYIEELIVEHMDTTEVQAQKYPDYFVRKWAEEKKVYGT